MQKYFEYNYQSPPFDSYGTGHLLFLALFGAALRFLIWGWKNPGEKGKALGSQYMYSMRKPETASALDLMGPWPWYLLTAQFVALLLFVLLYLPFAWQDRRQKALASP
jgi:uncharacterized membrane protein YwaF